MITYKEIAPLDFDHMPVEVATEMLAAPKAKMSARQRKTCFAARQRIFYTGNPLHRRVAGFDRRHLPITEQSPPVTTSAETKLDRKFRSMPIARLDRLHRRVTTARRGVDYLFKKMEPHFHRLDTEASKLPRAQVVALLRIRDDLHRKAGAMALIISRADAELRRRNP
jgi:hypothetical protein